MVILFDGLDVAAAVRAHRGSDAPDWKVPIARTEPTINLPLSTMTRGSMNQDQAPLSLSWISSPAT